MFSSHLAFSSTVSLVQVVQPYSSIDTVAALKNSSFILTEKSDFYIVLKMAVRTLPIHVLISLSVGVILLPKCSRTGLLISEVCH